MIISIIYFFLTLGLVIISKEVCKQGRKEGRKEGGREGRK